MKDTNNIKKIIAIAVMAVIIIAGIIMICVKGFNYDLLHSKAQRMNIYMTQDFKINEIEAIANEVLGNNTKVQVGNAFGKVASIISTEITEEQENSIIEKINEKYEIEINKDSDVVLTGIPQANAWDLIVKYISPLIIATIIVLLYFIARFKNQGIINCLVIPVVSLILASALYISIIALTRLPVNEFFAICGVLIYFITIILNTIKLSNNK